QRRQLEVLTVRGLPVTAVWSPERAVISLADARRVADDFVLTRTLPSSVREFVELLPVEALAGRMGLCAAWTPFAHLIVRVPAPAVVVPSAESGHGYVVALFDVQYRKRVELAVDSAVGFRSRSGREFPAGGLRPIRLWSEGGQAIDWGEGGGAEGLLPPL